MKANAPIAPCMRMPVLTVQRFNKMGPNSRSRIASLKHSLKHVDNAHTLFKRRMRLASRLRF